MTQQRFSQPEGYKVRLTGGGYLSDPNGLVLVYNDREIAERMGNRFYKDKIDKIVKHTSIKERPKLLRC